MKILLTLALLAASPAFAAESKSDCLKKEASQYFERLAAVEADVEKGSLTEKAAKGNRVEIAKQLEEKVLACGGAHLPERHTSSRLSLLQ